MITSGIFATSIESNEEGYKLAEQWFLSKRTEGMVANRLLGTNAVVIIFTDGDIEVSEVEIEANGLMFLNNNVWATVKDGVLTEVVAS